MGAEAYRRLVPYTFLEVSRSSGGKIKNHFPRAEEMANYRERLLTDSPTGPSFSTARRRDPRTSATLEKPLARESLVALTASFDAGGQWLVCRADASPTEDP